MAVPFSGVATVLAVGYFMRAMAAQEELPSFHYTGLDGLWRKVILWGIVGAVGALISPIPHDILLAAVVGGFVVSGLSAVWLYQVKTAWIELTRWLGLLILILFTLSRGTISSAFGYLAVGAIFSASIDTGMVVFGRMALKKLNQRFFGQTSAGLVGPLARHSNLDPASIRKAFLEALPRSLRDEIAATFVPVTVIEPGKPSTMLPPEASSFGGLPFLQQGEEWPMRHGQRLGFLGQVNLAEAADFLPSGVPSHGLLSFFFDKEQPWGTDLTDLGSASIIFSPDPAACQQVEADLPSANRQALTFRTEIAQVISDELSERFYCHFRSLTGKARVKLDQLHDQLLETTHFDNRLFSPPGPVQNQMDDDLRIASEAYGLAPDTQWTMVLQIDSVAEQNWCWGDAGCLYFWIPQEDLKCARFDRPWVVLQCT